LTVVSWTALCNDYIKVKFLNIWYDLLIVWYNNFYFAISQFYFGLSNYCRQVANYLNEFVNTNYLEFANNYITGSTNSLNEFVRYILGFFNVEYINLQLSDLYTNYWISFVNSLKAFLMSTYEFFNLEIINQQLNTIIEYLPFFNTSTEDSLWVFILLSLIKALYIFFIDLLSDPDYYYMCGFPLEEANMFPEVQDLNIEFSHYLSENAGNLGATESSINSGATQSRSSSPGSYSSEGGPRSPDSFNGMITIEETKNKTCHQLFDLWWSYGGHTEMPHKQTIQEEMLAGQSENSVLINLEQYKTGSPNAQGKFTVLAKIANQAQDYILDGGNPRNGKPYTLSDKHWQTDDVKLTVDDYKELRQLTLGSKDNIWHENRIWRDHRGQVWAGFKEAHANQYLLKWMVENKG